MKQILQLTSVILVLFAGASAQAESRAERQACEQDAFRVCSAAIPDRNKVFLCMKANQRALSPACRAVIAQYSRPGSRHQEAAQRPTTTGSGGYSR